MRKTIMRLRAAFVVLVWTLAGVATAGPLSLHLLPFADTHVQGEPVFVGVRIANDGTEALAVPRLRTQGSVRLTVIDEAGRDLPYKGVLDSRASGQEIVSLAPARGMTLPVPIASMYALPPGKYSVRVEYVTDDEAAPVGDSHPGVRPWTGRLSGSMEVVVVPATAPSDVAAVSAALDSSGCVRVSTATWVAQPGTPAGQGGLVAAQVGWNQAPLLISDLRAIDVKTLVPRYRCVIATDLALAWARLGEAGQARTMLGVAGGCDLMADERSEAEQLLGAAPTK